MSTMRITLRWEPRGQWRITDVPRRCVFTGEVCVTISHPSLPLVPEIDFTVPVILEFETPPRLRRYTTFLNRRHRPSPSASSQSSRMATMGEPDSPRYSPSPEVSPPQPVYFDAFGRSRPSEPDMIVIDDTTSEEEDPEEDLKNDSEDEEPEEDSSSDDPSEDFGMINLGGTGGRSCGWIPTETDDDE